MSTKAIASSTALLVAANIRPSDTFLMQCQDWAEAGFSAPDVPIESQYGGVKVKVAEEAETGQYQFTAKYIPFVYYTSPSGARVGLRLGIEVFERFQEFPSATVMISFYPDRPPLIVQQ